MNNNFVVLPLDASNQKLASAFDCGSASVYNAFLRSRNALDVSFGKTFVFLTEDKTKVIGYYNIGVGDVEYSDGYQRIKSGGAIHINYLALDKHYRGRLVFSGKDGLVIYWSDLLLHHCLAMAKHIRDHFVGFMFVTLTSSKEGYRLYKRHDFYDTENDDLSFSVSDHEKTSLGIKMYLPLDCE